MNTPRRRGRKRAGTTQVEIAMPAEMVERIDAWRAGSAMSRPEAARMLISAALEQVKQMQAFVAEHQGDDDDGS